MMDKQNQSIGTLLSDLANETSLLLRQEIALAKVELTEKATVIGRNVGFLVLGGAVAYAALLALLAAVIILLANYMPWWAAAAAIGVIVGIVASVLISKALATLRKTNLAPRQTVETLKEDAQWAKQQMK
jgi:uncharacterized membrane protein YqjE